MRKLRFAKRHVLENKDPSRFTNKKAFDEMPCVVVNINHGVNDMPVASAPSHNRFTVWQKPAVHCR